MALITMSQNLGSEGLQIARQVSEELNTELYDDNRLQQEALKMGVYSENLKSLDEKSPGLLDRLLSNKLEMYLDIMEAVIYKISEKGQGVILGHGGPMLLRDFDCALHVQVHASEARRIANLMQEQNLNKRNAEKLIRKSDSECNGFFKFAFQKDLKDPSLYDLIINTEKIGTSAATKLITDLARTETISACSLTAIAAMQRLAQTKRVEAELWKNDINPSKMHIELPEEGKLYITGLSTSNAEKDLIMEVVRNIPEIHDIQAEIAVATYAF